jgi:ribosomal protein S7
VQQKTQDDPLKVFKKAMDNVKPQLEVKSRRVGGSTYQVPVEVPPARQLSRRSPRRSTSPRIAWVLLARTPGTSAGRSQPR